MWSSVLSKNQTKTIYSSVKLSYVESTRKSGWQKVQLAVELTLFLDLAKQRLHCLTLNPYSSEIRETDISC